MPTPSDPRPRLIFGCGYLGLRVARAWADAGHTVYALTRGRGAELAAAGVRPVEGDVLRPETLVGLPEASAVLYAVGYDRRAGRPMREVYVEGLRNVLAALPTPGRFVYVSSTGVYGGAGGEWLTEEAPPDPQEESGGVVLAAEDLLRTTLPAATVLRFAGIYGPGRVIGRAGLLAGEPVAGDPERYLNLIHVADGVRAVDAALGTDTARGGTFNVCDDAPPTRGAYYAAAADVLGAAPPRFVPGPAGANRRIRNARARHELGYVPAYPDCRAGLAACDVPTARPTS